MSSGAFQGTTVSKTPFTWPSSDLGSARVSRVGDGVLAGADFLKDCFGETPKPTRETRALPSVP